MVEDTNMNQLISELSLLRKEVFDLKKALHHTAIEIKGLREVEERYCSLIHLSPDAIALYNRKYEIIFINNAGIKLLGAESAGQIISKKIWEFIHPDSHEIVLLRTKAMFEEYALLPVQEEKFIKCDSSIIDVEIRATPTKLVGQTAILAIVRDISDRKKAEKVILQTEERFQTIFNATPALIVITTLDGRYIEVNDNFLKTSGYTRKEVLGRKALELGLYVDPKTRSAGMPHFLADGEIRNQEVEYRMKSGEVRIGLSSAELIELGGRKCILAIVFDITETKKMEKEMARFEQLNLVAQMAAGIGHEVRNPMTTVRGFLQLLKEKKAYKEDERYFDLMIEELDRANGIITEYLSLAKIKPDNLKRNNINLIIQTIAPLIEISANEVNKKINIKLNKTPDILLNEKEIRQLLLNLINNALEAMPFGGNINLYTYVKDNSVVLLVKDQGKGIPPAILDKLGTPFITTKDSGTGLGLAVCYSIAARHNAHIEVQTDPEGTSIFVYFPINQSIDISQEGRRNFRQQ